jgi:hypothetical protein
VVVGFVHRVEEELLQGMKHLVPLGLTHLLALAPHVADKARPDSAQPRAHCDPTARPATSPLRPDSAQPRAHCADLAPAFAGE